MSPSPFLKCHCFYSHLSKDLNALNYFPGSRFEKRNMHLDIGFCHMNFAFPNSALDSFYLRRTLKFKRSSKNLKIAFNYFPGSGFGKRCMLSGLSFLP